MNREKIEREALGLPSEDRAKLAQKLLLSLESPAKPADDEWLTEAVNRARDIDRGDVTPIDADEVRRRARSLLR